MVYNCQCVSEIIRSLRSFSVINTESLCCFMHLKITLLVFHHPLADLAAKSCPKMGLNPDTVTAADKNIMAILNKHTFTISVTQMLVRYKRMDRYRRFIMVLLYRLTQRYMCNTLH